MSDAFRIRLAEAALRELSERIARGEAAPEELQPLAVACLGDTMANAKKHRDRTRAVDVWARMVERKLHGTAGGALILGWVPMQELATLPSPTPRALSSGTSTNGSTANGSVSWLHTEGSEKPSSPSTT